MILHCDNAKKFNINLCFCQPGDPHGALHHSVVFNGGGAVRCHVSHLDSRAKQLEEHHYGVQASAAAGRHLLRSHVGPGLGQW